MYATISIDLKQTIFMLKKSLLKIMLLLVHPPRFYYSNFVPLQLSTRKNTNIIARLYLCSKRNLRLTLLSFVIHSTPVHRDVSFICFQQTKECLVGETSWSPG